jgi:hypothetical protein
MRHKYRVQEKVKAELREEENERILAHIFPISVSASCCIFVLVPHLIFLSLRIFFGPGQLKTLVAWRIGRHLSSLFLVIISWRKLSIS